MKNFGSLFYKPKKNERALKTKRWNIWAILGKAIKRTCMAIGAMVLISALISAFLLFIDSTFYEKFAAFIYIGGLLLLAGLFVFGKNINGATSWYSIAGIGVQPTEFAKTATLLALGKLLNDKQFNFKLITDKTKAFTIILIPALLITLQPDPGSALVYASLILLFHREGLNSTILIVGALAIVLCDVCTGR